MYITLTYYNKYNDPVEYECNYDVDDISKFAKELKEAGTTKESKEQFAKGFVAAYEFFDLWDTLSDYEEFKEFLKNERFEEAEEETETHLSLCEHDYESDDEL